MVRGRKLRACHTRFKPSCSKTAPKARNIFKRLCSKTAPKARNIIARGKCDAKRSTSPLGLQVARDVKGLKGRNKVLRPFRAASRFLCIDPGATSRQSRDLPLAFICRAFGAVSLSGSESTLLENTGCALAVLHFYLVGNRLTRQRRSIGNGKLVINSSVG